MGTIFTSLIAAALAVAIAPAWAQEQPQADRDAVIKLLDQAMPRWTDDVLRQPDAAEWTADLTLASAVRALDARELVPVLREAPDAAEVVESKQAALRVDAQRGNVRYVNRARAVDLMNDRGELPDAEATFQGGLAVLGRLGLPVEEFAKSEVATQMAAGGSIEASRPERVDEIYRLFVVERVVNDLPVFGSKAIVAFTDTAEIQRLGADWPVFRMNREDLLLERETVLEQSADILIDQGMRVEAPLTARLGYAPVADEPGAPYVPVAMIAASIEPTPVLVTVPLVAPGDPDER